MFQFQLGSRHIIVTKAQAGAVVGLFTAIYTLLQVFGVMTVDVVPEVPGI